MTWELRWHPFRGQWVLFTSAPGSPPMDRRGAWRRRSRRPAEDNALAPPGGRRLHGTNPDYRGVYVFTNDLPVFSPDAPEPTSGDEPVPDSPSTGERPRSSATTTTPRVPWPT